MPFTNILVGLVLIALTAIFRVSLFTLRRTARLYIPRPELRPINADRGAYELLYTMGFDALFSICQAVDWAFSAVTILLTFFLCCELLRTAIFIVSVLESCCVLVYDAACFAQNAVVMYLRIALWMLACLVEAEAYLIRLML